MHKNFRKCLKNDEIIQNKFNRGKIGTTKTKLISVGEFLRGSKQKEEDIERQRDEGAREEKEGVDSVGEERVFG